ncbi:MAG: GNAT family N-acetyltransferase [Candidatus Eremiobacteraeota bacterium]|nr:GNAT family N-acetyltransferase [Candidatus Eremiobacteraeota bacterium]
MEQFWTGWLANDQVTLMVGNGCFAIAAHSQADFATGQPETIVVEQVGFDGAVLAFLQERARVWGDEFLALRHYPEDVELGERLPKLGFAPELTRITRSTEPLRPIAAEVRPARARDRAFMSRLHIECSPFYRSSNRQGVDLGAIDALSNYLSLDLRHYLGWVDQQRRGYVLLERDFTLDLLERRGVYLYDIAVKPVNWGQGVAVALHESAMAGARALGYRTVVGDIAFENERAFWVATEKLGYRVEWRRWGINL